MYDASTEEVDEEDDGEEIVVKTSGEERMEDGGKKSPEECKCFSTPVVWLTTLESGSPSSSGHVVPGGGDNGRAGRIQVAGEELVCQLLGAQLGDGNLEHFVLEGEGGGNLMPLGGGHLRNGGIEA
jgi:hypothetical protein